jgi:hypothetical protein
MATKKATRRSRTKLPKKSSPKKRVVEHAAPEPPARALELEDWLNEVRDVAEQASSTGAPKGACLVPDPRTGGNDCIRTDKVTCTTKLHGTWIGGPCGPS